MQLYFLFKMIFAIIFTFILVCTVSPMYSSKSMEGYPSGYLTNCPGSNKTGRITKKSFKLIALTVQGSGNILSAGRTKYSYHHMKELARDPNLDFKKPTALYVGGYLDSPTFAFAGSIGVLYRELGYNVLHLDTNPFTTMEYPISVRYMKPLGKKVAEMLNELTKEGLINPKQLEVVGLSLGGQLMSFIAKEYKALSGVSISTLIGLDPAGPCYRNLGPEDRLDPSDADFVNVIHTGIDGFGMAAPIGHVNFYVNGGEYQPGDILWNPCGLFCSHIRSLTIWLAALKHPDSFIGIQCDSIQQARDRKCYDRIPLVTNTLDQHTDRTKPGLYYLTTDNNYPYYQGQKGLKKENDFFWKHVNQMNKEDVIVY